MFTSCFSTFIYSVTYCFQYFFQLRFYMVKLLSKVEAKTLPQIKQTSDAVRLTTYKRNQVSFDTQVSFTPVHYTIERWSMRTFVVSQWGKDIRKSCTLSQDYEGFGIVRKIVLAKATRRYFCLKNDLFSKDESKYGRYKGLFGSQSQTCSRLVASWF